MRTSFWYRSPKLFRRLPVGRLGYARSPTKAKGPLSLPAPKALPVSPYPHWSMQPLVLDFAEREAGRLQTELNLVGAPLVIASPASAFEHPEILHAALVGCMAGSGQHDAIDVNLFCGDGMFRDDGLLIMRLWMWRKAGVAPSVMLLCEAGKTWVDTEHGSSFVDFTPSHRPSSPGSGWKRRPSATEPPAADPSRPPPARLTCPSRHPS